MCGLCGNYNGNQGDDFLTPSGMVEALLEDFGNSWKLNADCQDLSKQDSDPCNLNPRLGNELHPKLPCAANRDLPFYTAILKTTTTTTRTRAKRSTKKQRVTD